MATIQVVLDDALLELADKVAKQTRVSRSALIREVLRTHLKRLRYREMERRERVAYQQNPADVVEARDWERVAAWPNE